MDIGQFILTLSATIVGGVVVICTNWISAQRTRRESVQDWFKQTYISEGVDPLITFFVGLEVRWNWGTQQLMKLDDIPVAALAKIQILLDSDILTQIAIHIQNFHAGNQIDISTQITFLDIGQTLLKLRKELLKIIPTQVNEKNYPMNLPDLLRTTQDITDFNMEFQSILSTLKDQMN